MLRESIIKRLLLARYLYHLAEDNARSHREVASFAAINILQDAIEMFLLAAVDHLNAGLSKKAEFESYIDKINEKLSEKLPYRQRLIEINKVRVLSKHNGVRPNSTELVGYISTARQFFDEATRAIFGQAFWTLSLIDLLNENDTKRLLQEAERKYKAGEYPACLIECRKAFYLEFEKQYDIQGYNTPQTGDFLYSAVVMFGNHAPYHARNIEYIKENVRNPFDYIVLDHAHFDSELVKEGLDPGTVWNIWRLTPRVYRHKEKDEWLIKYEPIQFELEEIENRAAYVLENMIDIVLKRTLRERSLKFMPTERSIELFLKCDAAVFEKADDASKQVGIAPRSLRYVNGTFGTKGLSGQGFYWRTYFVTHPEDDAKKSFVSGYIRDSDVAIDEAEATD